MNRKQYVENRIKNIKKSYFISLPFSILTLALSVLLLVSFTYSFIKNGAVALDNLSIIYLVIAGNAIFEFFNLRLLKKDYEWHLEKGEHYYLRYLRKDVNQYKTRTFYVNKKDSKNPYQSLKEFYFMQVFMKLMIFACIIFSIFIPLMIDLHVGDGSLRTAFYSLSIVSKAVLFILPILHIFNPGMILFMMEYHELFKRIPARILKINKDEKELSNKNKIIKIKEMQMEEIKKEENNHFIKVNAGDKFLANYHYEIINKFTNKEIKGWMKSTYEIHSRLEIWFIRLDGFESDSGWTNRIESEDLITEVYTGDKKVFKQDHKFKNSNRLIFDIKNIAGKRTYIFKGVFEPSNESNEYLRLWRRVSDNYKFV